VTSGACICKGLAAQLWAEKLGIVRGCMYRIGGAGVLRWKAQRLLLGLGLGLGTYQAVRMQRDVGEANWMAVASG
jgi:hypothetical protein